MTHTPGDQGHDAGFWLGGTFNGPVAAGYQARAVQVNQAGSSDERAQLQGLLQQLEDGIRQLGGTSAEAGLGDITRIKNELEQHPPDAPRISQLLQRVTAVVAPVSGLLELADRVKELVTAILH